MSVPLVAVVAPSGLPPPLYDLLVDLVPLAHPCAFDRAVAARIGGCVLASLDLIEVAPANLPLAVWVDAAADAEALRADEVVRAVLATTPEVVAAAGPKGVLVPTERHPFPGIRPMLPAVRSRVRRAFGLQSRAIAVVDDSELTWAGRPCGPELIDTALACASAVVVRGPSILRAMAWAAPIVTDVATSRTIGAEVGREVLVEERDPPAGALELADDDVRASGLARRARVFYEERFDTKRAVQALARNLDIVPTRSEKVGTLLDELRTPLDFPGVARTRELLAPFAR